MKNKVIKIIFSHGTMMFGDSYKTWQEQVEEYMRVCAEKLKRPSSVEISNSKFVEWGGLKWCSEESFQEHLNREGCQYGEPDNPNPRLYSDMLFEYADEKTFGRIIDLWERGQKIIKVNKLSATDYELYRKGVLKIVID